MEEIYKSKNNSGGQRPQRSRPNYQNNRPPTQRPATNVGPNQGPITNRPQVQNPNNQNPTYRPSVQTVRQGTIQNRPIPNQARLPMSAQPKPPAPVVARQHSPIQLHQLPHQKLKIIPLGGQEEVGRNMTIFEYGKDIIIIDMGLQFPEEDMPGIDYIVPNVAYLKGKEANIRAVIFSHGHLDHIGAAPILLKKLNYPTIVGRNLTLEMVKDRVEDHDKGSASNLKTILIKDLNDTFSFGAFNISFFQVEHSIMDAVGIIIKTPEGTIIHPGDWTMEKDEQGNPLLDYRHLSKLPRPTMLMLESLGAIDVRPSASSIETKKNLTNLIANAPGRIIIGTFSSQIERIAWIFEIATALKKKVALDGYSMKNNVEIAHKLGYIKIGKEVLIKINQIDNYPENRVVVLCTGSQGEGNAVLSRIIDGDHKNLKLRKNDTVVLSSSIIPGNERTIQRLKDNLYRLCDNVIHGSIMDIHVSGHGNREDLANMLKMVNPDYFMPIYANHYMLKEAAKLAKEIGMREEQVFVVDNGQVLEMFKGQATLTDAKVMTDYVMVDGSGIGDISEVVLRDRRAMSEEGMLVIIATIDKNDGRLIGSPDIISRGFVYMKENKELIENVRTKVKKMIKDLSNTTNPDNENNLKNELREKISQFLFSKTHRKPMILPVIINI